MSLAAKVYIGLGTNLGSRLENLQEALNHIKKSHQVLAVSSVYANPPLGFEADTDFYNAVISIKTLLNPMELLKFLKDIEIKMGRIKNTPDKYESRIIDLDILDFNGEIYESDELKLPHPEILNRDFVLLPWQEIAESWIHPVFNKNLIQLAEQRGTKGLLTMLGEKLV